MRPQWVEALRLARLGLPVFPLAVNTKAPPAGRYGAYKTATTDEAQIRAWAKEFPDHNYGVHPGPGHALVLDLDVKGDGESTLAALEIENSIVPYFLKVRTPSGGLHLYVWLPEGHFLVGSSIRRLGPGIDVKCATGHVVGPGCTIDNRAYEIEDTAINEKAREAPKWLLERCGKAPECHPDADKWASDVEPDSAGAIESATRYVRDTAPEAIEGHGGNNTTYEVACRVRDMGLSEEQCVQVMVEYNRHCCRPKWDLDDLHGIVQHAYQYAQNPIGIMASRTAFTGVKPTPDPGIPVSERTIRFLPRSRWGDLPRPEWLIEGYLPARAVVVLWGMKNAYKTFVALDMLLHAAAGHEQWCGYKIHKRKLRVGIAAGEGAEDMDVRATAWEKEYNEGRRLADTRVFLMPVMPRFGRVEDVGDLKAAIDEDMSGRVDILVLDTLARATRGLKENETDDMKEFMDLLGAIAREYGCTVLVIHHGGKSKTAIGPRGAQAIADNADVVIAARGDEAKMMVTLQVTEQRFFGKPEPVTLAGKLVGREGDGQTLVFRHHNSGQVRDAKTGEIVNPDGIDAVRTRLVHKLLWAANETDLPWDNGYLAEQMRISGSPGSPKSIVNWVEDAAPRFLPQYRRKPGKKVEWWVPDDLRILRKTQSENGSEDSLENPILRKRFSENEM